MASRLKYFLNSVNYYGNENRETDQNCAIKDEVVKLIRSGKLKMKFENVADTSYLIKLALSLTETLDIVNDINMVCQIIIKSIKN